MSDSNHPTAPHAAQRSHAPGMVLPPDSDLPRSRHWTHRLILSLVGLNLASMLFEVGLPLFRDLFGVTLSTITSAAVLATFTIRACLYGIRLRMTRDSILLLVTIGLYWALSALGTIYSEARGDAFIAVVQSLYYIAVLAADVVILQDLSRKHIMLLLRAVGGLSLGILSGFFIMNVLLFRQGYRATTQLSVFRDYNMFVLTLYCSLLLLLLHTDSRRLTFLVTGLFLLMPIALVSILVGSRRATIFYFPIVCLALFLGTNNRRRTIAVLLIVLLLVSLVAVFDRRFDILQLTEGMSSWITRGLGFLSGQYTETVSRTTRWIRALDSVTERPFPDLLIGKGTRAFYADYRFQGDGDSRDHPHNFLLSALFEGGILKLVAVCCVVLAWYIGIRNLHPGTTRTIEIALFFLLIATAMISGEELFFSKLVFFVMATLILLRTKESEGMGSHGISHPFTVCH